MRRFCRNVDVKNTEFIKRCIYLWLEGKKNRKDVQRFLARYAGIPYLEIREALYCEDDWFLESAVDRIAEDIRNRIIARDLELPPVRYRDRYDHNSGKWRKIGIQQPIHQIFDYIAVEGCMEMFSAKIGPYQMASLPGRGQEKGVKTILKWLQTDEKHTRYYAQADVKKCYPSIDHDNLKRLFARDVKNPELLWLIFELIDAFPEGLGIGSYFSQYACNYYLSYAYHYASEQLFKIRKKRNGPPERVRLVYHIVLYMDDILFFGSSEKDVKRGMDMMDGYLKNELKLELKPNWKLRQMDYIGKDGKHHGYFVDMMGYRIYRDHITVRRKTFRGIRRTIIRAETRLKDGKEIPLDMAYRIISHAGKIEYGDSCGFSEKHNLPKIKNRAEKVISSHDKALAEERKRRKREYEKRKRALPGTAGTAAVQHPSGRNGGGLDQEEHTAGRCPF